MKSEGLESHPGLRGQARKLGWQQVGKGLLQHGVLVPPALNTSHARPPKHSPMAQTQLDGQERHVEAHDGVTSQRHRCGIPKLIQWSECLLTFALTLRYRCKHALH